MTTDQPISEHPRAAACDAADLAERYRAMGEREATEWIENMVGDVAEEPR
jgi:hypothetical protein